MLTVEGFDLDAVTEMIANADLGSVQQTVLTESLRSAEGNPDMLSQALSSVREALGM